MGQFKFKLQPVLFQRNLKEQQCQRDLAKALRQRMILHHQLKEMQDTITGSKRQLGDGLVGKVDLDQVSNFARYSGQATQRAHALVTKLAVVEKQVDTARAALVEAARSRQALELLRQRRYEQWAQKQDRAEMARLDELAVQQYARRMVMEAVR